MLKRFFAVVTAATLVLTMNVSAAQTPVNEINSSSSRFDVSVKDLEGSVVSNADVYIYSFEDDRIVASGTTDSAGYCSLSYFPQFDEKERENIYRDFLIYVQKDGYFSSTWDLTKFYDYDDINETKFTIQLAPDNQLSSRNTITAEKAELLRYVASKPEQPFYVIKGEELSQLSAFNANSTRSTFWNEQIPLGYFHVCKGSTLSVEFTASDKVNVESGTKNDFGSFSIKLFGNRRREFSSKTTFPEFTTTSNIAKKKLYLTSGTFEQYYTVDGPSGRINEHYVLDSIIGGTIFGATTSCYECNESYDDVDTDFGNYLPILEGGSATLTNLKGSTLDFGLSVPLTAIGLEYSLGVKVETTAQTDLTYTPKSGYDIALYDIDRSKEVWHVTCRTAN